MRRASDPYRLGTEQACAGAVAEDQAVQFFHLDERRRGRTTRELDHSFQGLRQIDSVFSEGGIVARDRDAAQHCHLGFANAEGAAFDGVGLRDLLEPLLSEVGPQRCF